MTDPGTIQPQERRLLAALLPALLGRDRFAPRPDGQKALAALGEGLCKWLDRSPWIVLVGGDPANPTHSLAAGLADSVFDPTIAFADAERAEFRLHLAGFWRDRRLVMICLRKGLTVAEFDHLYHLLGQYPGKGLQLRSRFFEEQTRGHLANVSLVFHGDLIETGYSLSWEVRVALSWLQRDLNLLSRCRNLTTASRVNWREQLLSTSQTLPAQLGQLPEFFAHLDLIAETIENYDKDELVFTLLEQLDTSLCGELCLNLCRKLERLSSRDDESASPEVTMRRDALTWITRRLAEQMIEQNIAGPEHLHALVLNKVLLYEEIPPQMRARVASLQVLTSFLANPLKYFAEVENSHSPEVLATRLWRILSMLPKLVEALRFDAVRQVVEFSRRFGPSFELQHKPEIMQELMTVVAGVLMETRREQQAALMTTLPQLGRGGVYLLIDLADHSNRSVRRTAFDALLKIGQPVVPVLFEALEQKQGWHYLRNMLLLLAQLNVGGTKVEQLFRRCLAHPEANVRKEALPGIARLLKQGAAPLVADALGDSNLEVKKRAAACLALTGINDEKIYRRLSAMLAYKECDEGFAMQVVVSINSLKPAPPDDAALESALLNLLGVGGFLGFGGGKGSSSQTLRVAVAQALGYIGSSRSQKALAKLSTGQDAAMAAAVAGSLERLTVRE